MKIVVVSHDADFTGAPRVAFDIASALSDDHDVTLISKREGPLIELPKYANLVRGYIVTRTSHAYGSIPSNERVRMAMEMLDKLGPDLVYANSTASCEWCVAARRLGIPSVLHTHEMEQGLRALSAADVLKLDIPNYVDLLVSASKESTEAFAAMTSGPISRYFLFGIAIETDYVKEMAAKEVARPQNVAGQELSGERTVIAMCGTAASRKGFDIFYDTAQAIPDADFLWIGPLSDDATVRRVLKRQETERIENFYVTGETPNPYAYMRMCDIFALTSVEDPNPLVVPEALTLGKRVVSFQNTGGSWQWTRRFGYSLSGAISTERLTAFLKKLMETNGAGDWIAAQASALQDAVDLRARLPMLRQELSKLVEETV